jgi:lysophospholipid acyltransferase (LPLAT)-like uncharacterized protein
MRRAIDAALGALLRALAATWRVERRGAPGPAPVVLALWHGELLPLILCHRGRGYRAMVSRSSDGDRLAALLQGWGFSLLRGSSSRGGLLALRGGLSALRAGDTVAIAVDGPRGPAGEVKPGAAHLAALGPARLVAARARASAALRWPSWDRACIPLPFARIIVEYTELDVNPSEDPAELSAALQVALSRPSAPSP